MPEVLHGSLACAVRRHRRAMLAGAGAFFVVALFASPTLASTRPEAVSEFSLAFRLAETTDTPPPDVASGGSGNGTIFGWEGGLLLPGERPLSWGATVALSGGQRHGAASLRLRLRHRFARSQRYFDLSPGLTFATRHEFREPAGAGFVCGVDYGFSHRWAATLQFERLPMKDGPPRALTNLNLGMKVCGRAGLVTGTAMLVAVAISVVMIGALVNSMDGSW